MNIDIIIPFLSLFMGFTFGYAYAYITKGKVKNVAHKITLSENIATLKTTYENFIEVFFELKKMYLDTDDILKKNFFYIIENELRPQVIKLLKLTSIVKKQILNHPELFENENLISIITEFERKLKLLLEQTKDLPKDPESLERSISMAKAEIENFKKELLKIPAFVCVIKEANVFKDLKDLLEIQSDLEKILKNGVFFKIKREISIRNESYRKTLDVMELVYSKLSYKLNAIKEKLNRLNSKIKV